MYFRPDDAPEPDDAFPWLAVAGCVVIIASILGAVLASGMCTEVTPC